MWIDCLPSMGLFILLMTSAGYSVKYLHIKMNDNKPNRVMLDDWDHFMADRDKMLTGSRRGSKWL